MHSFLSIQILDAARAAAIDIGEKQDQLQKLELDFGEENPLFLSDRVELLKVPISQIKDEEGRTFYIGYTRE